MLMDKKVFRDISYGMYFISSMFDNKKVGCIINTLCQITSNNPIISISLNKNNYTNSIIKKAKVFAVSIISNDTSKEAIGKFGYYSSDKIDKFDGINYNLINDTVVVEENICGYLICNVLDIIDCDSHDIIIAKVINSKKVSNKIPMTYKYYHENLKGVSPKNAPTYIEENNNSTGNKYKCRICGYIYDDSREKIKFDDLPDDWKCPLCGAGKDMFEKI